MADRGLIEYLSKFVTEERLQRFEQVLENRTRYISVLLEDVYQQHNSNAVLRTCDCFGIQDVHVIENRNSFNVNDAISLGSSKWLSIYKYSNMENNAMEAIKNLKGKGYRIIATLPHTGVVPLHEFDLTKGKTAILFGTELQGLSPRAIKHADEFLLVPMVGFTESFNISVTAGIILHHLSLKLRSSLIDWKLSEDEKDELRLNWLRNSIKRSELLEKEYVKGKN